MKTLNLIFFSLMILLLNACKSQSQADDQESEFVKITEQQFSNDKMQLSEITLMPFDNVINCTGNIVPMPDGKSIVSAPVKGTIQTIYVKNGQRVRPGEVIMEISGNEIIDLQKEFVDASATYKRLAMEYERLKLLYAEKVLSEKDFIQAESSYASSFAMYKGLKMKLEGVHLIPSRIENGEFYSAYPVKTPMGGAITNLTVNTGSYVEPQTELAAIINPDRLHLKLSVFAADARIVKEGQVVRIRETAGEPILNASISSVGVDIDPDTRSVPCYARIDNPAGSGLIANQFVECGIVTQTDSVYAVSSDAILKSESGQFVLLLMKKEGDTYFLEPTEVTTGRQNNGFIEITSGYTKGRIISQGVYNIVL